MSTGEQDKLAQAIDYNTEAMNRLSELVTTGIDAISTWTPLQVTSGASAVEEPPEVDESAIAEVTTKLRTLFGTVDLMGMMPRAVPSLIRESHRALAVEIAAQRLVECGELEIRDDGLLYKVG